MHAPPVPSALAGLVHEWDGYDLTLPPNSIHHGLPSPTATVIISFGEPLACRLDRTGDQGRYWCLASGIHTGPAVISSGTTMCGMQLNLTPAGVSRLLGVPIGALANTLAAHDDLPLGIDPILHARLHESSWPQRFALIADHLQGLLRRPSSWQIRPEAREAWRLLTSASPVAVNDVARHIGWSPRHLQNQFRAVYGVGPKQAASIARFNRARLLVDAGRPLADVAHACGYTDQAHLNREWRRWAEETPTQTAQGFRNVQAEPALASQQ